MKIKTFFDQDTSTLTYIVFDEKTTDAIIIDPVLDYDPHASKLSTHSVDAVESFIKENSLTPLMSIETHAHADHLSGSPELKNRFPNIKVAISENIQKVQHLFKGVFNFKDMNTDGSQFDVLFKDQEELKVGSLTVKSIATPGHTPACASYLIEDALFTGDALFMPDQGTGRCDFPAGSAKDLYESVHEKLYSLPNTTRVFVGHDYQPNGRELRFESTIKEQKESNIQLQQVTSEESFVSARNKRDSVLKEPKLIYQSVQVNINAGSLPSAEDNGIQYIKMPLNK